MVPSKSSWFIEVAEVVAIEVGGVEIDGGLVAADEAEEAFGGGAIDFITHRSGDAGFDVRCPRPVAKIGICLSVSRDWAMASDTIRTPQTATKRHLMNL